MAEYELFCEEILAPAGLVKVARSTTEGKVGAGGMIAPSRLLIARSEFFDALVRVSGG